MGSLSVEEVFKGIFRPNGRTLARLSLALAALLAGVFVLPYAFPPSSKIVSASSLAGFNNSIAYASYVALLIPVGILAARLMAPLVSDVSAAFHGSLRWRPTPMVWLILAGHAGVFVSLYAVKGHLAFADGVYFHQVLARMSEGAVPYRDVNFLYGPAMLYPAFWLSRWLSVPAAYLASYTGMYLAGLYLLYLCLQAVPGDSSSKDRLYLFCAAGFFNAVLGLNYVLVRFLLPVTTVALVFWSLRHLRVPRLFASVAVLYLTFVYSLEMGVLSLLGILALGLMMACQPQMLAAFGWVLSAKDRAQEREGPLSPAAEREADERTGALGIMSRAAGICFLAVSGVLCTFYAIDPTFAALSGYLKPMLVYSAGGGSRPLAVSLPFCGILLATAMALGLCLQVCLSRAFDRYAALVMALFLTALLMQRAAFGKPDVLHIIYSGLPVVLMGLAVVPNRANGSSLRPLYCLFVLLAFVVPLQLYNVLTYAPVVKSGTGVSKGAEGRASEGGTRVAIQNSLDRLVVRLGTDRTYYLHVLSYYSVPVVLRRHLHQVPYLTTLDEAFTPEDIQQVILELEKSRAIVISHRRTLQPSDPVLGEGWRGRLFELMGVPALGSEGFAQTVTANDRLRAPLLEFLVSSYDVVAEDGELVALALCEDVARPNMRRTTAAVPSQRDGG